MSKRSRSVLGGFETLESKRMFAADMAFADVDQLPTVSQPSNSQVIILGDYLSIRGSGSEGIRGNGSEGLMATGIPLPATADAQHSNLQDIIAILGARSAQPASVDIVLASL